MRCSNCLTIIPHRAQYCPKCGSRAPDDPAQPPMAPDAHPAKAPIPAMGKVFIAAGMLGLALLGFGIGGGNRLLMVLGAAILGIVALVMVIGHHVS
jgi:hypothetical protein